MVFLFGLVWFVWYGLDLFDGEGNFSLGENGVIVKIYKS